MIERSSTELEQNSTEEALDLASVEALMQTVVKGLRATQLYLPNNPVYQKAMENMSNAFKPVWEEWPDLVVDVTDTALKVDGQAVLTEESKSDSLAWTLYKDGIRSLRVAPGVEEGELANFLKVVQHARNLPADAPDDLLTLLWEQDFEFLKYDYVEMGVDDAPPLEQKPTEKPPPDQLKEEVQEEVQEEEPTPAGIVSMDDFDSTLYFLDDSEIDYLNQEIEREYQQDLRGNVLFILFDLLELQSYSTVRAEIISIIEHLLPYLLGVGDFRSVAVVLRELDSIVERARELLPEHREKLRDLPARLSESEALGQLLQSLDEAHVHPTEAELGELFRQLRAEAIDGILYWLPQLSNERVRELLRVALKGLAQDNPERVNETLKSGEPAALLEAIELVRTLQLSSCIPALGKLLEHSEPSVRLETVNALAEIGTPSALQHLSHGIDDSDREVRIAAVRAAGEAGHRGSIDRVNEAINSKAMRAADLTEKRAFFEAYGRLAGSKGVEKLGELLVGKGFMKRKEDSETRACAAMALGRIATEEAREFLLKASKEKDAMVKNAVNQALREASA